MKAKNVRLVGIRCFTDTGDIKLSDSINLFVGSNNAGKSTILKTLLALQGFPFSNDVRTGSLTSYFEVTFEGIRSLTSLRVTPVEAFGDRLRVVQLFAGTAPSAAGVTTFTLGGGNTLFYNERPMNIIVPFIASRKTSGFNEAVNATQLSGVTGTYHNLYARIDQLATTGHPCHEAFKDAVKNIIGVPITTRASPNGKVAGYYYNKDVFISLDRMGDGVTEMVALIVELCLEENKIFALEEPETNLHPKGLKALLDMIRASSKLNQFVIATHSNIVVRELGATEQTKVFRVSRDGERYTNPSYVEEVARTPEAHRALLEELGYNFTDLGLHEGWLFLEESSAESIIRSVLIPMFAPGLAGKIRTYSSGGVGNLEPSIHEFQRLITFVHLEPAYRGRLWVRADGDQAGIDAVAQIRAKFEYLDDVSCATFSEPNFENYYPAKFEDKVSSVLGVQNKKERQLRKAALLREVIDWTTRNPADARASWAASATEVIETLQAIDAHIRPMAREAHAA